MSDKRQITWDFIREKPDRFTIKNLARAASLTASTVRAYVEGWEIAGYLTSWKVGDARFFKLVRDVGAQPPMVNRKGKPIKARDDDKRIWDTMRRLKTFTVRDIQATASLPGAPIAIMRAEMFCQLWAEAGYLKVVGAGDQAQRTYRFVLDTGPKPPRTVKTISVVDQNGADLSFTKDVGLYA